MGLAFGGVVGQVSETLHLPSNKNEQILKKNKRLQVLDKDFLIVAMRMKRIKMVSCKM